MSNMSNIILLFELFFKHSGALQLNWSTLAFSYWYTRLQMHLTVVARKRTRTTVFDWQVESAIIT